jgi:class 3 adenylate cyclase
MKSSLLKATLSATFAAACFFLSQNYSFAGKTTSYSEQWERIEANDNDSISSLLYAELSDHYYFRIGNAHLADSTGKLAIASAKKTGNKKLLIKAYINFIEHNHTDAYYEDLKRTSIQLLQLIDQFKETELYWEAHYSVSMMHNKLYQYDKGLKVGKKSRELAHRLKNSILVAKSNLVIGKALEGKNLKLEAYKNYLNALAIGEELNDRDLLLLCYNTLNFFYIQNNRIEKASETVDNLKKLINSTKNVDSFDQMRMVYREEEVNFHRPDKELNKKNVLGLLDFAKRHGYLELKESAMAAYRSQLLKDNKLADLKELYYIHYPEELEYLSNYDKASYYRIIALINEHDGEIYKALENWGLGEAEIHSHNKIWQSNYFIRYGQFLNRNKMQKKAISKLNKAYELAGEASYYAFMKSAVSILETIYQKKNNYSEAYYYSEIKNSLKDSIAKMARMEDQVMLEVDREFKKREVQRDNEKKKEQARLEKETIQKKALAGILLIVLFSGILLLRQYKQTRKAKDRSDNLLLNILPSETAEELKEKGYTTARRYEDVTIIYSDIKGFTQLASILSPEELVNELHEYFSAFDEIIQDMGLEKIKTIGDAYIAVGGVPEGNKADAVTVARAAIAMRKKVLELKNERIAEDRPYFEMRTGLNSGPVVAGTVGTVKFQYDIWGDAVNMAARMEENCEVGSINISESTYLKINNSISCKFRGEIDAKNKGKVPMYYINLS